MYIGAKVGLWGHSELDNDDSRFVSFNLEDKESTGPSDSSSEAESESEPALAAPRPSVVPGAVSFESNAFDVPNRLEPDPNNCSLAES
jgi:hypothetical protein